MGSFLFFSVVTLHDDDESSTKKKKKTTHGAPRFENALEFGEDVAVCKRGVLVQHQRVRNDVERVVCEVGHILCIAMEELDVLSTPLLGALPAEPYEGGRELDSSHL